MKEKNTVLWFGRDLHYSVKDGISWHLSIPGFTLPELIQNKSKLLKGAPFDWKLDPDGLSITTLLISRSFLSKNVTCALFFHKDCNKSELKHLKNIYSYLQKNFKNIRLLNSPFKSHLFRSKIHFSEHISQLPNAKYLLPEWFKFDDEKDLDMAAEAIGFPLLIKPDSLSGGKGIVKVDTKFEALKLLKIANNGRYQKTGIRHIKDLFKSINFKNFVHNRSRPPIKLLISEYVDTYHNGYNCYLNATVYYWANRLCFADARVSHKGFNIHAGDSTIEHLSLDDYSQIAEQIFDLIKRERFRLDELVKSLDQHSVRVDCLINLEKSSLKVAEVELKSGPGNYSRKNILPVMKNAGWDLTKVRRFLNVKKCSIEDIFTD